MIDISFRVTVGADDVAGLLHLPGATPAACGRPERDAIVPAGHGSEDLAAADTIGKAAR